MALHNLDIMVYVCLLATQNSLEIKPHTSKRIMEYEIATGSPWQDDKKKTKVNLLQKKIWVSPVILLHGQFLLKCLQFAQK